MKQEPERLQIGSLAAHSARGIIRDRTTRRRVMAALISVALVMVIAGSTLLANLLDIHEHLVLLIVYWTACAWLTISALLLAMFDLLAIRAEARAARRVLRERVTTSTTLPNEPE